MWIALTLLLSLSAVDARVTFAKSEVLDNVDLKGANALASFRCSQGCRLFSPTKSDSIIVIDKAGNQKQTLRQLSEKNPAGVELPGGAYQLKNTGLPDPAFVFYAVEKGAANYNSAVVYVSAGVPMVLNANSDGPVTIMSSTGAVSFGIFSGFIAGYLPTVYAAGFDSIGSCKPVLSTSSVINLAHSSFPVNSPIATIYFKSNAAGQWVSVTGDSNQASMNQDSCAVYVSPGYVGCPNLNSVGDSLYTFLPAVAGIDAFAYLTDSKGLSVSINGDYSIANQADALTLTINGQENKLYGNKKTYTKSFSDTSANLKLSWTKKQGSKDAFAFQIDISSKGSNSASSTTYKPTTSSVNPLSMLLSSVVISLSLAIR